MAKAKMVVSLRTGPNRAALETVEIPSMRLARRIAANHNSSAAVRAEYSRSLIEDAQKRAHESLYAGEVVRQR